VVRVTVKVKTPADQLQLGFLRSLVELCVGLAAYNRQ